jgi:hypothetical protein
MSEEKRPFKKGDQVSWRGKTAKITSDVIHIEGVVCDLRIECDDDEVLTVSHSELLAAQLATNEQDRSTSVAFSGDKDGLCPLDDRGNKPKGELDDEGVTEVLKHVGPNDAPGNLDREELRNEINAAWDFYHGYEAESSKGRRAQLRSYAGKLCRAAQNLSGVLDQSDPLATSLRKRISHRIRLNEFRERLHGLVQLCQVLSTLYNDASSMSDEIGVSPLYLFLGDSLPSTFEKHFKQPAKRTRNAGGHLDGPFIRFATAVTARLGNPVTGETVSKAMTEVAKVHRELE